MKLCEANFIRNHKTELSKLTIVNDILLAKLCQQKIIGSEDKEILVSKPLFRNFTTYNQYQSQEHCHLPTEKSHLLYKTIAKAKGSDTFFKLVSILSDDDLRQTGAVAKLKEYSCSKCAPREEECLPDWAVEFGVPSQVSSFTGRVDELQRLHELIQRPSSKMTVVSQATTVSGMGGIGKTGLVIEYVKTYSKHYQGNILWINADSAKEVQKCYRSLAQRLKIDLLDRSGEPRDIKQIKEDIYANFVSVNCIFVFDNCTDPAFVGKECIPSTFPASFCTLPKFLLTSRNQEWDPDVGVLPLDEMKPEEAEELIMKRLYLQESNEDVSLLAQLLQHFPLAIQQATAYIYGQQRIHDDYTIASYMDDFKNKSEKLLNIPILGIDNKYKETTFTTWQISFEEIRKNATAANILHMMAYIAPDNVKRQIFRCLFPHEDDVEDAVKLICKYSLLKWEQKQYVLSIHRLVQEVIRLQLESSQDSEAVLGMCLKLLTNTNLSETSHPTVIWGRASRFGSLIEQFYDSSTAAIERQLTPLHILAQGGDFEGVKSIVNYFRMKGRRDEINKLDCYGRTPLILACEHGHVKVVEILLDNKARTDIMAQSVRQRKTFAPRTVGRTAMLAAVSLN